jgi:quercetin dioxygenase-like cupin family protein
MHASPACFASSSSREADVAVPSCRHRARRATRGAHLLGVRRALALGGCALAMCLAPPSAGATEGSDVSATTLATGTSDASIKLDQEGSTEVTVREIMIAPGGSTGWHYHAGEVLAVVQAGTLTRQLDDCSEVTTPAGQTFIEPAGQQHVHIGRNLGTEPVVLYVAYVLPTGSPLALDADDPGCAPADDR